MSHVLHRNISIKVPTVKSAEGNYLIDDTGKKYLDASGGAAVSCLGHTNKRVINAIKDQLDKVSFAHTGVFTNEPAEELASYLIENAPQGFGNGRAMFLGSGSEAMEAALKLARQYHLERGDHKRSKIIARDKSYHGNTLAALATGGHKQRQEPFSPLLIDVAHIPPCYKYRYKKEEESEQEFGLRMANTLEEEIITQGPENVAAFVVEPVSGASLGAEPAVKGYFKRIREICDQYGVLLIADEVMCGMGRTGYLFAMEAEDTCPDIITIAKGLGAGYQPIASVMASEKVIKAIEDGSGNLWNGHTYMSHAIACAGALAVLKVIEEDQLLGAVRLQGEKLKKMLTDTFANHPNIGDIRGRGLFWGLEIVKDKKTKQPFPAELNLAGKIKSNILDRGMLSYPSQGCVDGKSGDHILLAPPYTVSDEELDIIIDITQKSLQSQLDKIKDHD
ncbi:MAG: aspartate aminotransferase family protein [Kordiimonadaceae bacterium]|jgi:adenosylmethionine-8-amino-7-oxononanoate aminotransferase|nr:aspartate aminotransferase family protein [Kordiimonadaceae bacterium]